MSGSDAPHNSSAAYDAEASFYAASFPTTEPEQRIDLAIIDLWITLLRATTPLPLVLDAGCGAGRMGRYVTDRGCHAFGIDASMGMVGMAHRDHPELDTEVGSILDVPFANDSFDGALYWYSLIHLHDSELPTALTEVHRVLRPGGLALFAFQSGEGVREVMGPRKRGHDVTLLRYHRSGLTMSRAANVVGLEETLLLERAASGAEQDPQAFLIVSKPGPTPPLARNQAGVRDA